MLDVSVAANIHACVRGSRESIWHRERGCQRVREGWKIWACVGGAV